MAVVCQERQARRGLGLAAASILLILFFQIATGQAAAAAADAQGQAPATEAPQQTAEDPGAERHAVGGGPTKERKRSGSRKKSGEKKAPSCWPGAPGTDPRLCPPNDP